MICFHWKLKLTSGMYGDAAVDCANPSCDATWYVNQFLIFVYRLFGRIVD